jgi:hypothetical protein
MTREKDRSPGLNPSFALKKQKEENRRGATLLAFSFPSFILIWVDCWSTGIHSIHFFSHESLRSKAPEISPLASKIGLQVYPNTSPLKVTLLAQ